jgi:hypothetical protein
MVMVDRKEALEIARLLLSLILMSSSYLKCLKGHSHEKDFEIIPLNRKLGPK